MAGGNSGWRGGDYSDPGGIDFTGSDLQKTAHCIGKKYFCPDQQLGVRYLLKGKEESRGSISVFFALLLTTILAVLCTSLESARHAAISYLTAQAGESALESAFAGYYRPLWEEYHLFFMADGPGFIPFMEDALSYYEEPEKGGNLQGKNLYGFCTDAITVRELATATDNGGMVFLKAIMEDMEKHGMTELAEFFLEQEKLVKEAEAVSDYIGSLSEYEKTVLDMEENYSVMENQGKKLRGTYESLKAALETGALTEMEGRELLHEAKGCASEILGQAQACHGEIFAEAEKLKDSLKTEEARLLEQKENVSQASYEQMAAELENLEEYTREEGSRRKAAEETKDILEEYAEGLIEAKGWEGGGASEELKEVIKKGSEALEIFEESSRGKRQKSELLEMVKSWKDHGILGLVLENAENISDRKMLEESIPSETVREAGETVSASEKGAAVLYAVNHFGHYGEEKENSVLAYEVEYILGGMESDKENLTKVVERLLAVRSGMNFLYLLSDSEKQAEAELAATALVGFTGIYPLVKIMKGILLGAWAFAEAVSDVRILYKGGQVPLIKTERDWKLSLEGAADAASYETETKEEKGIWNYEGYLCILLLMGSTENLCFRMMDLIEINLRKKDSGFFMENCISYALVEFRFQAEKIFFQFSIPGNSRYIFQKMAAYSYYDP